MYKTCVVKWGINAVVINTALKCSVPRKVRQCHEAMSLPPHKEPKM